MRLPTTIFVPILSTLLTTIVAIPIPTGNTIAAIYDDIRGVTKIYYQDLKANIWECTSPSPPPNAVCSADVIILASNDPFNPPAPGTAIAVVQWDSMQQVCLLNFLSAFSFSPLFPNSFDFIQIYRGNNLT